MMKPLKIDELATLRVVVGYLGEKEQFGWWPCSFFGAGSSAFLTPVFGRTAALAQYTAVANAAARVHDEFLGVGNTYHLFRLPEEMEQDIHAFLADPQRREPLSALVGSRAAALACLPTAGKQVQPGTGPTLVGNMDALHSAAAWKVAAAQYAAAFAEEHRVFPYFADRAP